MKFCECCMITMTRISPNGYIEYQCERCGNVVQGDDVDARVGGSITKDNKITGLNATFIKNAPFDQINKKIDMQCDQCGLRYMSQIREKISESVLNVCKCGKVQTTATN